MPLFFLLLSSAGALPCLAKYLWNVILSFMHSKEFWPFLFFAGLLLLNWPFLNIFGRILPLYFTFVWAGFIGAVYLSIFLINRKKSSGK